MASQEVIDTALHGLESNPPSAAPKKRRRRVAATGASEDCFSCRKRQTKCDRRRPYCGQCLEVGKDCSGYKTTLTWGVGVASRGKLRGLSCPVAKQSAEQGTETKKSVPAPRRKASTSKPSKSAKEAVFRSGYTGEFSSALSTISPPSQNGTDGIKTETDLDQCHPSSLPISVQQSQWHLPTALYPAPTSHPHQYDSGAKSYDSSLSSSSSLPHLHTSLNPSLENMAMSASASSLSTFSDGDYGTNSDFTPSPANLQYPDGFPRYIEESYPGTNTQDFSTGVNSAGPCFQGPESFHTLGFSHIQYPHQDVDGPPEVQYKNEYDTMNELDIMGTDYESQRILDHTATFSLNLPRSLYVSQFSHLSHRMQYLLDYYDKHICSVLVAFDSPVNPYRQHILELATQNEGLQNAIAALAINNLRMRDSERPPTMGFIEEISESDTVHAVPQSKPSPEESCYKTVSITQLQMQLADPRNAQDDSILATLLILCLFHVCDSGFSKFKTQLEGVQKLLSMRSPSVRTGFIGWVEMFFTWFDVMTSTVNDRETEIRGDRLDMMQYSSNLGALEEFSGCDGRLFKLIARLGRLNLLSQNRPVRSQRDEGNAPRPYPPLRKSRAFGPGRWQKRKVTDPMDFTKLDGNGWGMPLSPTSEDDNSFVPKPHVPGTDSRHEFWSEWADIRDRLLNWSMNESIAGEAMSMSPEQLEMMHINEMFRSAALLYTERLAHPQLPSSSPNLQVFVRQALTHITSIPVNSCVNKFLLWPLFIAGTECVDANDRANVRERCVEIMKESGFYNNLSVLEVLERVWAEQGQDAEEGEVEEVLRRRKDSTGGQGGYGQAFRWRKAMDRVDGEYIIV